jgi:hypothetical protein
MSAALTHRQQIMIDLLSNGPRTTRELAEACGYRAGEKIAHDYVRTTLVRLAARGLGVRRVGRKGSHHGCLYFLMERRCDDPGRCWRCGSVLASDHSRASICSPCERALVDEEIAAVAVSS